MDKFGYSYNRLTVFAVGVLCVITFFVNNDVLVPDIMESRNIITAREMVSEGNWLLPTMNGELRLEKPPLPTWLTALADLIAPDSLALQRGMAGGAALLLVVFFWKFAGRVLKADPVVSTLLLCTCYNVILMGRTASWDIYTHAFMMGGIYYFAVGMLGAGRRWGAMVWAGVFTGLSIMSKGPVSLYALYLPFLAAFIIAFRPSAKGKGLPLTVMTVIALTVGGWWFVYVHAAASEALQAVVRKESGSWLDHNVRPWWYYYKFFLETGVWSVVLLTSMIVPLLSNARRRGRAWVFSMIWMVGSLVLLSLMPEKKPRYLFPLLIPAAYVMGCQFARWGKSVQSDKLEKITYRVNGWVVAVAVSLLPVAAWFTLVKPGYVSLPFWIVLTVLAAAIAAWLIRSTEKLRPLQLLWGVAVLFAGAEIFAMPAIGENIINNPERRSISALNERAELQGIPFYYIDTVPLRIELVYAAHRPIKEITADSVAAKAPCVVLTHERAEKYMGPDVLAGLDTVNLGRFDDNRRPKGTRRYSDEFIYNATLVKPKKK